MTGPIPLRKEIRNLSQVEMYLYFEGLAKFQQVDMDDPLSYYQIAGRSPIHSPLEAFGPRVLIITKS